MASDPGERVREESVRAGIPLDARASADVTQELHPTVEALRARFGQAVLHHEVTAGDQHVVFIPPEKNLEILGWLKGDPAHHYDFLADVTAVDYGGGRPLIVVYQLWSMPHGRALRVKCELPLTGLEIGSVSSLWSGANWLEREVYDMFGIQFRGHPDLRRILMPENYAEGHPLRKDFPLRGRFSRAEQTRRALSQDPRDYYTAEELALGEEPQLYAPRAGFLRRRGRGPGREGGES
ncbi:MAG: NADH-quinone oxidoreductase subunit C [Gemmatimonadetes bacterium]|nr:NADH-quinone oxidoreductase subunit C [Gemmatimonadota bacterium]